MKVVIRPSRAVGAVMAPPSKSMAHRSLICAGLSVGESVVRNLAMSKDIEATIGSLRALGAVINLEGDTAYVTGADLTARSDNTVELFCNESGSTLRFFAPLCMLSGNGYILSGSEYLFTRPLSVYEKLASEQGIVFEKSPSSLKIKGVLKSGTYEIAGNISSQFVTGLLFALPLLDGDSELRLIPPVESGPYIDLTLSALGMFGVEIKREGNVFCVKGSQSYRPADVTVEGDCSNAAFFEALNCAGSDVTVEGLDENTLQGDRIYKILYEKIKHRGGTVDISDCPDLGPVLFAVAALSGGAEFTGTRRLKLKESDRAEAMREELGKFGIDVCIAENSVTVSGAMRAPSEELSGHGDHRIVMALSVLCTVTGGVINGAQAVSKSFPDFFDKLSDLGVDITYGMDQ